MGTRRLPCPSTGSFVTSRVIIHRLTHRPVSVCLTADTPKVPTSRRKWAPVASNPLSVSLTKGKKNTQTATAPTCLPSSGPASPEGPFLSTAPQPRPRGLKAFFCGTYGACLSHAPSTFWTPPRPVLQAAGFHTHTGTWGQTWALGSTKTPGIYRGGGWRVWKNKTLGPSQAGLFFLPKAQSAHL